MSDHQSSVSQSASEKRTASSGQTQRLSELSSLELIDQCLASLPEGDERIALLYQLRHRLIELTTSTQQHVAERTKMQSVTWWRWSWWWRSLVIDQLRHAVLLSGESGDRFPAFFYYLGNETQTL